MAPVAADQTEHPAPALILVRSDGRHDSREIRVAEALRSNGYQPLIVGVVSERERDARTVIAGTPVMRLSPTSPLAWARSRLRRGRTAPPAQGTDGTGTDGNGGARSGAAPAPLVRLHRWLRTLDFYRRAIRVLRSERPVLLHCNDYNTMWVGVAARLLGGTAVIYDAHELWPDRNQRPEPRWWLLACEWLFVRCAHRTIATSPGHAEVMGRRYRIERPTVVRNIPLRAAREDGAARKGEQGGVEPGPITYVGALTTSRGLEVAIAAVARVPGARLRLVGPGRAGYSAGLLELARREGVADRVELAGAVPPGEVVEELAGASVGLALIQPSCLSYELSLPNKLFEYVLAGVPVLGSDLPVIGRFIAEHGVGLATRADDVGEIAAKLTEMLRPERNRELRAAVRSAARGLSWEHEAKLLAAVYADAAARAGLNRS